MQNKAYVTDAFVEQIPIGILTLGADGSLRNSNKLAFRLIGMDVENALADVFLQAIPVAPVRNAVARIRSGSAAVEHFFFERDTTYLKCTVSRFDGADDGSVIVILEDATVFRQMDRIKLEFIETILHGLRNPLSTLKTSLSILNTGKISGIVDQAKEIIDMSAHEVDRLNALLVDLRSLFFIETGLAAKDFAFESFPVGRALRRAVEELDRPQSPFAGLGKRIAYNGDMDLAVFADFENTRQIVWHVLKNACVFAPGSDNIRVCVSKNEATITVEVRDEGIGVDSEQLPLIFNRFFRVDNDITRQVSGNGLGLFVSRSLTELMGGSIYCESTGGKGASFFITLPVGRE